MSASNSDWPHSHLQHIFLIPVHECVCLWESSNDHRLAQLSHAEVMRSHCHGNRDQNWNSFIQDNFSPAAICLKRCVWESVCAVSLPGGDDDDGAGSSSCYSYPVPIKHVQLVPVRAGRPDVRPLQIRELTIHDAEKLLHGATAWYAHKHTCKTPKIVTFSPGKSTLVKISAPKIIFHYHFLWPLHLNRQFLLPLKYNWPLLWLNLLA